MNRTAAYRQVAIVRARELWSRMAYALVTGAGVFAITGNRWVMTWVAAVFAGQLFDHWLTDRLRNDPDWEMSRRYEAMYVASFAINPTIFSVIAPACWLSGGLEGHLFAFLIPTSGLLNVGLQTQAIRRLLVAGCLPHALALVGLPVLSIILDPGADVGMAFVAIGVCLYLLHLMQAMRRSSRGAEALDRALRQAQADRLEAESANAAKSEFLATMSHEIRTPLNGVLGMAQAMSADELPERQRARLDVVRQSGEVLLVLLNDLLDISRIEAAKLDLEAGVVDLRQVAAQAEAAFAPLAAAKGVGFEITLADGFEAARGGDPVRVRQVIYNLLANAVKFTDAGSVAARLSGDAAGVRIEVADTGPGIAPEALALLFERFAQADASTTRRFGGSGLGLAISRGLARAMGGEITATSTPGEGSVFTAVLPLAVAEAANVAVETEAAVLPDRLRVLAAEDNATNQLVLRTLLEPLGVDLHMVGDGAKAVAAWGAGDWDVILMDVQMPVMDGVAAAREIRRIEAAEGRARTPIVALTANAMSHQTAEYVAVGMDALSPKPIQLGHLIAAMAGVIAPRDVAPLALTGT